MIAGTEMPLRRIVNWSHRYFLESPYGLLYMDIKNYSVDSALVTILADKNIIIIFLNIFVLNVPELSKIILVDLAWILYKNC